MHKKLERLFEDLDQFDHEISLSYLRKQLQSLNITRQDVGRLALFGKSCYRRNLIHEGPGYQALILCWRSGQRSPIHDHKGSACALRVIEGTATETIFEMSPCGLLYATKTSKAKAGSVRCSFDMDIHQMGNLETAEQDLITLHIYSPPLLAMGTYFLGNAVIGEDERTVAAHIRRRVTGGNGARRVSEGQRVSWGSSGPSKHAKHAVSR